MAKNNNYETHDFYCLRCGQKGLPIQRKVGKQHGEFHRKRLWCPHCKLEINHMEIRNQEEKEYFMEGFINGEYREEAEESLRVIGSAGFWQVNSRG
jgi:hypothetical protein